MVDHPHYLNAQMEANSRRVVSFNRYSGVSVNDVKESTPSKILASKNGPPDEGQASNSMLPLIRPKSSPGGHKSILLSQSKKRLTDDILLKNTSKSILDFDNSRIVSEINDSDDQNNTNTLSSEDEEIYLPKQSFETATMNFSKFADLDGGDYHLHNSTVWLLEQATTASSLSPNLNGEGILFFQSPEKHKIGKRASQNATRTKRERVQKHSLNNHHGEGLLPVKGLSKFDFDFDLVKSDKFVSPYLEHLKPRPKGRRLMSAPMSRSNIDLIPENKNQLQSRTVNASANRMIRSATSKQLLKKTIDVLTTSTVQKELPTTFGILSADHLQDFTHLERNNNDSNMYIETYNMKKMAKAERLESPGKARQGDSSNAKSPSDTAMDMAVTSFFFPSSSPKSKTKSLIHELDLSFALGELESPTVAKNGNKQMDRSWQMDPNFVAYHNHMIASIVNPMFAQKRYRFNSSSNNKHDNTINDKEVGIAQFKLPSVPTGNNSLSHNDPLYKLLIDEIANVKKSFQIDVELNAKQNDELVETTATGGGLVTEKGNIMETKKINKQKLQSMNSFRISPADLKMLSSFNILPPAMWVTARIVYFLFLAYYQLVFCDDSLVAIRNYMSIDALWTVIGGHLVTDGLAVESVEKKFSWPLLQAMLYYPIMFSKALHLIEHGPPDFVLLDPSASTSRGRYHYNLPIGDNHLNTDPNSSSLYSYGTRSLMMATNSSSAAVNASSKMSHRHLFYDKYPIHMLAPLRRLVVAGSALFDKSSLIHTVPAGAKLCSWARRIVASIFASCWHRDNNNILYVPPDEPMEDYEDDVQFLDTTLTTTATALVDVQIQPIVIQSTVTGTDSAPRISFFAHIQMPYTAGSLLEITNMKHNAAFLWAMKLARPTDQLEVVVSTSQISNTLKTTSSTITTVNEMMEVLDDRAASLRSYYESCIQYNTASPLHRVLTLKSIQPIEHCHISHEFVRRQSDLKTKNLHDNFALADIPTTELFEFHDVVKFVLENSINNNNNRSRASKGGNDIANNSSVLVVDQPQSSKLTPLASLSKQLEEALSAVPPHSSCPCVPVFPFSLMLCGQSEPHVDAEPHHHHSTLLSEESVGITYLVCITDSRKSWEAYQMACRMIKPLDKIIVLHVPVLEPVQIISNDDNTSDNGDNMYKYKPKVSSRRKPSNSPCRYLDWQTYQDMLEYTAAKADYLVHFYKNVGVNLFVDTLPPFFAAAERVLRNSFSKTTIECVTKPWESTPQRPFEYDMTKSGSEHCYQDNDEFNAAISRTSNIYMYNQSRRYISEIIHAVVKEQRLKPCIAVLGADNEDIFQILSGAAADYREICVDKWADMMREDDNIASNTFITASNPNTMKSNEFTEVTDTDYNLDGNLNLDDLTTRMDNPETNEKGSNHGMIRKNQSSNVSVEDVYCYTDRRIGLIEQLLTTNTKEISKVEGSSIKVNAWPSCSYLLSNEVNSLR